MRFFNLIVLLVLAIFSSSVLAQDSDLINAIESNDLSKVNRLINSGMSVNTKNDNGELALFIAAKLVI
jgi:hypothetical protein